MGSPGSEFVDVTNDLIIPRLGMPSLRVDALRPMVNDININLDIARANTDSLLRMIAHVQATGGYIAVPPGRYPLGPPTGPRPSSEIDADIVIGHKVALTFMPTGQLIPITVMPGETGYPTVPILGHRPGTPYKVRLEIQGMVEAAIHPIFDVFQEPRRDNPVREAGTVVFTRLGVSRVYPEWWGAIPAATDLSGVDNNSVRRTTKALQAAIDAARPPFLFPNERRGARVHGRLLHRLFRGTPPVEAIQPLHGTLIETDGVTVFRRGTNEALERQTQVVSATEEYRFEFLTAPARPPIPVILTNDYVIDDELSVGHPCAEVTTPPTLFDQVFRRVNHDGFVLVGSRGSAHTRAGNVQIIAWAESARFRAEPGGGASEFPAPPVGTVPAELGRPPYGFVSMLGLREVFGARVEGVTFDARGVVPRCVTLEDVGPGQQHHNGFEGCAFLNARAELVHVGGELFPVASMNEPTGHFATLVPSPRYQGNQDLSNLRFLRCLFGTSLAVPTGVSSAPSRCAVYFRTGQSLGVEYRSCTFEGPANPMIHAVGGRFLLDGCEFHSRTIEGAVQRGRLDESVRVEDTTAADRFPRGTAAASTNGLDIFIDNPPFDCIDGVLCVPGQTGIAVSPACFTARDVFSDSPQFLATFNDTLRVRSTQAATVLLGVRHAPVAHARPSVHWKGAGEARCTLTMSGCEFNTVLVLGADLQVPVIDLGNRVTGTSTTLFTTARGLQPTALLALQR